ncbi:hypothetical protein AA313_de0204146 [Arthrobotrys entomopaga]|nr:hypothetical protein AA313_de0204146 [Arthrobotrys entomopaga]
MKRQLTIPSYASNCQDAEEYSSACECIGVTTGGTTYIYVPAVTTTVIRTFTITDTTTFSSDSIATVQSTTTTTVTSEPPVQTRFRIRATEDEANGIFKGLFINRETTPNGQGISFVDNAANGVGTWAATIDGNVTSIDQLGWVVANTGEAAQIYNLLPTAGSANMSVWVHSSNWLLQVDSQNRIYLGASNSTLFIKSYIDSGNIFANGDTGPLILEAVPSNETLDAPPPAATPVNIQLANVTENGAFVGQYIGTTLVVNGTVNYQRVTIVNDAADAATFLVDPINGNLLSLTNEPFVTGASPAIAPLYKMFPPAGDALTAVPVPCRRLPTNFRMWCASSVETYFWGLPLSETNGEVFVTDDAANFDSSTYIGPFVFDIIAAPDDGYF